MSRLRIADTDVDIRMRTGETILDALRRAGYAGSTGCRRGGCGICKVYLIQGTVSYRNTVAESVLDAEERAQGVCLMCRAVPDSDTAIAISPEFKLRCVAPFLAALARY